MSSGSLRAGIIGAGRIAWQYDGGKWDGERSVTHSSCYDRHPRTKLVAMLEPDEDHRKSAAGSLGNNLLITDDEVLFFAQNLDIVSICSPSAFHAKHIRQSLAANVQYIWIEKPVTLELSEYEALLRDWDSLVFRPKNTVNYLRRGLPQFKILKESCLQSGLRALDFVYSRGLEINGVHMLDMLGYLLDLKSPPKLDWVHKGSVQGGTAGNPSFGLRIGNVDVSFRGLDVPFHCIECRAYLDNGRVTVLGGGLEITHEPRLENADYPGFFHLGTAVDLLSAKEVHAALLDGTYSNLVSLIDDDEPSSTLHTAYFAQALLEQVQGALRK